MPQELIADGSDRNTTPRSRTLQWRRPQPSTVNDTASVAFAPRLSRSAFAASLRDVHSNSVQPGSSPDTTLNQRACRLSIRSPFIPSSVRLPAAGRSRTSYWLSPDRGVVHGALTTTTEMSWVGRLARSILATASASSTPPADVADNAAVIRPSRHRRSRQRRTLGANRQLDNCLMGVHREQRMVGPTLAVLPRGARRRR